MRFRLITLLSLMTMLCAIAAEFGHLSKQHELICERRLAFRRLESNVQSLDSGLRAHILQMPNVAAQLRVANPIDPAAALGESVMGDSTFYGRTYSFKRSFHYDWQVEDGARCDGISVTARCVLNQDSYEKQEVQLIYEPNELNNEVSSWLAEQMRRNENVEVRHLRLIP